MKYVLKTYSLFDAESTATSLASDPQDVRFFDNIGLNIDWTGTTNGTITVEGSNSKEASTFKALTFDPVLAQPSGSSGGYLVNVNQFPWPYLRVAFARVSGSGTLTVTVSAKEI